MSVILIAVIAATCNRVHTIKIFFSDAGYLVEVVFGRLKALHSNLGTKTNILSIWTIGRSDTAISPAEKGFHINKLT